MQPSTSMFNNSKTGASDKAAAPINSNTSAFTREHTPAAGRNSPEQHQRCKKQKTSTGSLPLPCHLPAGIQQPPDLHHKPSKTSAAMETHAAAQQPPPKPPAPVLIDLTAPSPSPSPEPPSPHQDTPAAGSSPGDSSPQQPSPPQHQHPPSTTPDSGQPASQPPPSPQHQQQQPAATPPPSKPPLGPSAAQAKDQAAPFPNKRFFPNLAKSRLRRRPSPQPPPPPAVPEATITSTSHSYWAALARWLSTSPAPTADHISDALQLFDGSELLHVLPAVPLDTALALAKVLGSSGAAAALRAAAAHALATLVQLLQRQQPAAAAAAAQRRTWPRLTALCEVEAVSLEGLLRSPLLPAALLSVISDKDSPDDDLAKHCCKILAFLVDVPVSSKQQQEELSSLDAAYRALRRHVGSTREWRAAIKYWIKEENACGEVARAFLLRAVTGLLKDPDSAEALAHSPQQRMLWLMHMGGVEASKHSAVHRWAARGLAALLRHEHFRAELLPDSKLHPAGWLSKNWPGYLQKAVRLLSKALHKHVVGGGLRARPDVLVVIDALEAAQYVASFIAAQLRLEPSRAEADRMVEVWGVRCDVEVEGRVVDVPEVTEVARELMGLVQQGEVEGGDAVVQAAQTLLQASQDVKDAYEQLFGEGE